jgi:adenine-specific DNA-methyltransferase
MEKMTEQDGQSLDIVNENIAALRQIFPEAFTEGKVDFAVLRQLLGDAVDDGEEKYGLNWFGKKQARQIALTPSLGTLRPCPEESVDWDTTQNLFIEGDNLEVLKLLQKSYAGKVKMIYIDPPYNTGNEFIYPDKFQDNLDTYLRYTGQKDHEGLTFSSNTETSGRFHTNWLNMMYPRLKLARNLLRDNGAIFISIDDSEQSNLRKLCDEIYGADNFVANIVWQKKYSVSNDDPGIAAMHDHILVYKKSDAFNRGLFPRGDKQLSRYQNPDNDPRGLWASGEYVSSKTKEERPTLWYPIKHPISDEDVWPDPKAVWRYSKETHQKIESENRLYWGENYSYKLPRLKRYLSEMQDGIVPSTWWTFSEAGHNDEGQKETARLIGKKVFSTPKPTRLIKQILTLGTQKQGVVLDFFGGSCATANAVMDINHEKGGDLQFIMVQLPERCDEKSQALKDGYLTIADIGKERIRRAAAKIKEENPDYDGDLGFKVFKLDSSNIRAWNPDRRDLAQTLLDHQEHLVLGRSEQDVLYELLLKRGVELTAPIAEKTIAGKTVYSIGYGVLFACLNTTINREDVEALAHGIIAWRQELAPASDTQIIFRDSAFADDIAKTNMAAILEQNGIAHVRSL